MVSPRKLFGGETSANVPSHHAALATPQKQYDSETMDESVSPTATTAKRSRIQSQSQQHQQQAVRSSQHQIAAAGTPQLVEPSPAPKKPRIDEQIKALKHLGGTAPRPLGMTAPPATAARKPATQTQTQDATPADEPRLKQHSPIVASQATVFETPVATQLFEPDEPLTATQEAFVVDGFQMPSPPPFFPTDSQDRQDGSPGGAAVQSTQQRAVEWAESTKAFFDYIDQRRIIDIDA